MKDTFYQHLLSNFKELSKTPFLIAISGGVDSVVLSHLCKNLDLNFAIAHCNFQLRNKESDADETFVKNLAKKIEVECFVKKFNTKSYAKRRKRSIQMAAREQRYEWFEKLICSTKYKYILTAHHADDNLETFLINFTRGTGLNGLTGIPEKHKNILRPLLPFSSQEILSFARKNNIKWQEDSSNKSIKYLRNKLRHEVVPKLKEINPELIKSFKKTTDFLNDSDFLINQEISRFMKKTIERTENGVLKFKIKNFLKVNHPKAYIYEIFKNYEFTQWEDILNLLNAENGKQVFSKTHRLIKHREHLLLDEIKSKKEVHLLVSKQTKQLKTTQGKLTFRPVNQIKKNNKNRVYIDLEKLNFPLKLRQWKTEDVFYPYGMTGKKKVSKLLKDEKLSVLQKERVLVLTSNDKVIWIVGHKPDRRFLVTSNTKHLLKIKLSKQ